ncbi:hypothetical protein EV424DRAFT_1417861 [Suillus variegatus]|nr:hypothetical protein EV424DRAFT_1417861 [Suillus variegatus]
MHLLYSSIAPLRFSILPILALTQTKNDQPICHVFQRSSPSAQTPKLDDKETVVAMKNRYFVSHLGFCEDSSFPESDFPPHDPFASGH